MSRSEFRLGSILKDANGRLHKVIRFTDCFIVTVYEDGSENWLVPWCLNWESIVKY